MSYASSPHKIGPPFRAGAPTRTQGIRFTTEEIEALAQQAAWQSEKRGRKVSQSEVIRAGLAQLGLFSKRRVALDL